MVYDQLETVNATNITAILGYTSSINPGFFPLMLFGLFVIVTLGSYFSQKRLSGTGDFFGSATVGSYLTTIVALFLFFMPGVLDIYTVVVSIGISMGLTILFLLSKDKM